MRFWCLTNFCINCEELDKLREDIKIQYQQKYEELQKYALTEINIDNRGVMVFKLLRDDVGGLAFPMKRGWMEAVRIEDNIVDIHVMKVIDTPDDEDPIFHDPLIEELFGIQIFLETYVSKFRIRCIKYTSNRLLTDNEKVAYKAYEKEIENYAQNDFDRREAAFEEIPQLNLRDKPDNKNSSNRNRVNEKYADLVFVVNAFCDPENGGIENLRNNPRFSYKNAFPDDVTSSIMAGKTNAKLNRSTTSFHLNPFIMADNVQMNSVNPNWFHPILQELSLKNVNPFACPEIEWKVFAEGIKSCKKFESLTLKACNIQDLPSFVFDALPQSIKTLNLKNNDIKSISTNISRLTQLSNLNLSHNENLIDKFFPWKNLPESLLVLKLKNTGLSTIPSEVKHLSLKSLSISGKFIKEIRWGYLNFTSLFELKIIGSGEMNQITFTDADKLGTLKLQNCGIIDCMWNILPKSLVYMDLINNQITTVECNVLFSKLHTLFLADNQIYSVNWEDLYRNLPKIEYIDLRNNNLKELYFENLFFIYLTKLDLSNNDINSISCENLPNSLKELDLSHNELTEIGSLNHLTSLKFLKLNNNKLKYLPDDFLSDAITLQQLEALTMNEEVSWIQNFEYLSLAHNQLTSLPSGFATLQYLLTFDIGYNFIDLKTTEEATHFWKCLPKKITILRLSGNTLYELPCILSKRSLIELEARDCHLKHVCPQLRKIGTIDICLNDELEYLSFVPKQIFYPPSSQIRPHRNAEIKVITTKKSYHNTVKWFPKNKIHPYNFEKIELTENEKSRICHCCAKRGINCSQDSEKSTKFIIQTLMVSDYGLAVIESDEKVLELLKETKERFIDFRRFRELKHESFVNLNSIKNIQCWNSKEWKTEVRTEMCENCIKTMEEEIKTFYANVDNNFEHENEEIPKRKNNVKSKLVKEKDSQKTSLLPLNEVLLLNNSLKVDSFLISAINAIDLMPALKNSIISNTGNITHKELTKILQRETKDVQKLRETISEYTSDFQEDASAALEKLIAIIDKNSQELLQFTYNSTQQCECQLLNCSNVQKCVILHLTIAENSTASKVTFKDMLNSWEQIDRGSCVTCNSTKIGKYTVVFGNKQKYIAVEINAWINTSKGMTQKFVPSDNFNINEQLIFGKLWKLIGAIQYNDNIKHYITWKRDDGEKWIIIDDNKKSVKKELYKNLSNYRMLIFERLNVTFIDPENFLASRVEAHQQLIPGLINQSD